MRRISIPLCRIPPQYITFGNDIRRGIHWDDVTCHQETVDNTYSCTCCCCRRRRSGNVESLAIHVLLQLSKTMQQQHVNGRNTMTLIQTMICSKDGSSSSFIVSKIIHYILTLIQKYFFHYNYTRDFTAVVGTSKTKRTTTHPSSSFFVSSSSSSSSFCSSATTTTTTLLQEEYIVQFVEMIERLSLTCSFSIALMTAQLFQALQLLFEGFLITI